MRHEHWDLGWIRIAWLRTAARGRLVVEVVRRERAVIVLRSQTSDLNGEISSGRIWVEKGEGFARVVKKPGSLSTFGLIDEPLLDEVQALVVLVRTLSQRPPHKLSSRAMPLNHVGAHHSWHDVEKRRLAPLTR
jgi:hypothetical protein